jgi:hypothetical protein
MRGSLAHDACYQLMRMGLLPETYSDRADELLKRLWIEDGMWEWVAASEVAVVGKFGHSNAAARPDSEPEILTAP